jgi:hypothetical protein
MRVLSQFLAYSAFFALGAALWAAPAALLLVVLFTDWLKGGLSVPRKMRLVRVAVLAFGLWALLGLLGNGLTGYQPVLTLAGGRAGQLFAAVFGAAAIGALLHWILTREACIVLDLSALVLLSLFCLSSRHGRVGLVPAILGASAILMLGTAIVLELLALRRQPPSACLGGQGEGRVPVMERGPLHRPRHRGRTGG